MKITFFDDEFPCPSATFVLAHLTGLMDLGHEISILARRASGPPHHRGVAQYGLLDRTAYPPPRSLATLLRGARTRPGVVMRALNPLRYGGHATSLRSLSEAMHLARASHADVILAQHGHQGRIAARVAPTRAYSAPLVTIFHGGDVTRAKPGSKKYDQLFAHGAMIIANSRFTERKLLALGCPRQKLQVLHMGIDPEWLEVRQRTADPDGALRILSVARLVPVKGIEDALRGVAEASRRGVTLKYRVIGEGSLLEPLRALARELGVADRVRFTGRATHDEVREAWYDADLCLMPSVRTPEGEEETLGVAALEALSTGIPAIVTRTGGLPEVAPEGSGGVHVDPNAPAQIADAIASLASDPAYRAGLGAAGAAHVRTHFDQRVLNTRLADLLMTAARSGGRA